MKLLENKSLKLLSIVLAVVVWFSIREVTRFERIVEEVPIQVLTQQGILLTQQSSEHATVRFRGTREEVSYLQAGQIFITADLKNSKTGGTYTVELDPQNVKSPPGVKAVSLRPQTIKVTLDREATVSVPVKPNFRGEMPSGYDIAKSVLAPATVKVNGPAGKLKLLKMIQTEPLEMSEMKGSYEKKVRLMRPDYNWIYSIEPDIINVSITVEETLVSKLIRNVPVHVLLQPGQGGRVALQPQNVNITFRSDPRAADLLQLATVSAYVDCRFLEASGTYELPVFLNTGRFKVLDDKIEPAVISVTLNL